MDKFVVRNLSTITLYQMPDCDIRTLNKSQVVQLCTHDVDDLSLSEAIDAFGFLAIRFADRLSLSDIGNVYKLFIPILIKALETESKWFTRCEIINLVSVSLHQLGQRFGAITPQEEFREIYSSLFLFITKALQENIEKDSQNHDTLKENRTVTIRLHRELLSMIMSKSFSVGSSSTEEELFEEVLVELVEIIQILLSVDLQTVMETWKMLFHLMRQHNWLEMKKGSRCGSSAETFKFMTKFLLNQNELRFLEEYNTTQLHLKAILSLYEMKRSTGSLDPLLQIRPEDLMKVYGEIDQLTKRGKSHLEVYMSNLKGIILKLIHLMPLKETIDGLDNLPQEVAFKFSVLILDQLLARRCDLESYGLLLLKFITRALQLNKLVSSAYELRVLMARTTTLVYSCANATQLFYQLIGHLVQLSLHSNSHTCFAFRLAITVQESVLLFLPQSCVYSAFLFYHELFKRLSPNVVHPSRLAYFNIMRNIYSLISAKYQKKIFESSSRKELDLIAAIEKSRGTILINSLLIELETYPKDVTAFQNLTTTLFAISASNHSLDEPLNRSISHKLDALWRHLIKHWRNWGQCQWMANFLHLLVRVSVKVDPQLANRLKPLIDTILPQTTTVLLCIALLDCPNQPGNVVRSVAQLYVRKCNNSQVKDFLCGIHFHNPKSAILEQVFGPTSQEEILNPIDTHPTILPHNCCERTCCFVLANTTKTTVGNKNPTHSSIACNLTHAVDELQKLRNSGISSSSSSNGTRLLLSSDLNEIRALATKLNRLLEQFQC